MNLLWIIVINRINIYNLDLSCYPVRKIHFLYYIFYFLPKV